MKNSRGTASPLPVDRLHRLLPEGEREVCIALGFANTRGVAVGNLGFHIVDRQLRACQGVLVEHFFLPEIPLPLKRGDVTTEPDNRALSATDLVLMSISFEGDAIHLPAMLDAGGLPVSAQARRRGHPLVVGGGALVMINPEPIASFFDLLLVGESEAMLDPFLSLWARIRGEAREDQLAEFGGLPGVVVPSRRSHQIWSASKRGLICEPGSVLPAGMNPGASMEPGTSAMTCTSAEIRVSAGKSNDASGSEISSRQIDSPVKSVIWDEFSECANLVRLPDDYDQGPRMLFELARGCPRRCRFCAASRIYHPLREADPKRILELACSEITGAETVGLLALSAGDYTHLEDLTDGLINKGVRLSISSLPATFSRADVAQQMVGSGAVTLTLAPETGSDELRSLAGKPIRNEAILKSVALLGQAGVRRLRTYFIIGLPFETESDILAITSLLGEMRKVLPGSCSLSATVNAFVPKPRTPFQWAAMAPLPLLRERSALLKRFCPKGVQLRVKSFREARAQALLSRGDITWGPRLVHAANSGNRSLESACRWSQVDPKPFYGEIALESALPWEFLMTETINGLKKEWREIRDRTSRQQDNQSEG